MNPDLKQHPEDITRTIRQIRCKRPSAAITLYLTQICQIDVLLSILPLLDGLTVALQTPSWMSFFALDEHLSQQAESSMLTLTLEYSNNIEGLFLGWENTLLCPWTRKERIPVENNPFSSESKTILRADIFTKGETQILWIPSEIAKRIRNDLRPEFDLERIQCYYGKDYTETYTVTFSNGIEMDIKLCCSNFDPENKTNPLWTEAVLFDHGYEVACSEPDDEFFQIWELIYQNACYRVLVREQIQT